MWIRRSVVTAALVLSSTSAFADASPAPTTATAAGTSQAQSETTLEKLRRNFAVTHFGILNGPGLPGTGWRLSDTPDASGDLAEAGALNYDARITAAWKIKEDLRLFVMPRVIVTPVRGWNAELRNTNLGLQIRNIINVGGFAYTSQPFLILPTRASDRNNKSLIMGAGWVNRVNYTYKRLSMGLFTAVTASAFGEHVTNAKTGKPIGRVNYDIAVAPNAQFELNDKLALTVWWDAVYGKHDSSNAFSDVMVNASGDADLQPGVNWNITPNWSVNPYVNIITTGPNAFSAKTMSVNMYVSGTLL